MDCITHCDYIYSKVTLWPNCIKTNERFVQKEFLLQMTKRLLLWFTAINAKNWKNYEKRKINVYLINKRKCSVGYV